MLANYTVTVSCIWEQAKHHMNSIIGLSPISSFFCQVHKRKIHVRSSSRTKPRTHPQPQLLCSFFWCLQELDCAGSVLEVLASASKRVGDTNSHTWGAEVSVLAWFLTFFSQILIWSSHFTTTNSILQKWKKLDLSCFEDTFPCFWNKDWSACEKACRQEKLYW